MDLFLSRSKRRVSRRSAAAKLVALFASLSIGLLPVFVSATNTPSVQNSTVFTIQNSQPKVDGSTGALTQRIAIDIPPGRNGLQPDLALEYNSQRTENSVVGYGWSLSIPYIERLNKTGVQDLYGNNPFFTSSIEGELATTSISTSSPYRARIDNGAYNSYSFSGNVWTVYDKKGTKYTYGSDTTGRVESGSQTYRWMLQEIRDTNGNYVKYTYLKDSNQVYPYKIIYTGNGLSDGPFTVTFSTSTRPDQLVSYKSGFAVTTNYRISQIQADVSGVWSTKYALSYTVGNNGSRSLLSSVQETGQDDSSNQLSLPPLTFSYISTTTRYVSPTASSLGYDSPAKIAADVDGNGRNDISRFAQDTFGNPVGLVALNETSAVTVSPNPPALWANNNGDPYELGTRLIDLNADGKADIAKGLSESGSTTIGVYFNAYATSTGFSWVASSSYSGQIPIFAINSAGSSETTGLFADVNGDGLPDFVEAANGLTKSTSLGNGSTWDAATTTAYIAPQDLPNNLGTPVNFSTPVDVNGDGLDDWVYSSSNQTLVRLNTGSGWSGSDDPRWTIATSMYWHTGSNYYDRGVRFVDINGDGLVDYVRSYSAPFNIPPSGQDQAEVATVNLVLLNTGSGWATSTAYTFPSYITQVYVDGTSHWNGHFVNVEYANWLGNGQQPQDVIEKIGQIYGATTTINYVQSAQTTTNPELPVSLLVVSKMSVDDGNGNVSDTLYSYTGGKMYLAAGPRERKFAGFWQTTETRPNAVVTTYFNQGDTIATSSGEQTDGFGQINKPFREDIFDLSNNLFQRTLYRWDAFPHGNSIFVGLGEKLTQLYNGLSTHKDTAETYAYASSTNDDLNEVDEYGAVNGNSDGTFTDVAGDERATIYAYAASSSVNLSLPIEKRVQTLAYVATSSVSTSSINYVVIGGGGAGGSAGSAAQGGGGGGSSAIGTLVFAGGGGGGSGGRISPAGPTSGGGGGGIATGTLTVLQIGGSIAIKVGQGGNANGTGGAGYFSGGTTNTGQYGAGAGGGGSTAAGANVTSASYVGGAGGALGGGGGGGFDLNNGGAAGDGTAGGVAANPNGGGGGPGAGGGGSGTGYSAQGGGGGGKGVSGSVNGYGGGGGGGGSTQSSAASGGGGGGASSGSTGSSGNGGNGGAGSNGGNGGAGTGQNTGTGGSGGAGGGTYSSTYGMGGSGSNATGTNGTAGVVIFSYPTGTISATGGTITTAGGITTHTFTSDGTFTASATTTSTTTAGTVLSQEKYTYDNLPYGSVNVGNVTKTEDLISGTTFASTTKTYNIYGLPTQSKDADGNATTYTYDTYNMYVATSTNPLSQSIGYVYDYSAGKPKFKYDENGRLYQTVFDALDRVTQENQPDQTTPATLITKNQYTYTSVKNAFAVQKTSYLNSATSTNQYQYFDGLGRPIQTRNTTETANQFAVRDTVYDTAGFNAKESLPYFSTGTGKTAPSGSGYLFTTYAHDALGRITSTVNSVGTTTNTYIDWTTITIDPLNNEKDAIKDAYSNLANVIEHNSSVIGTTTYMWDLLGNLATTTDALGNVRGFVYDGLNRRVQAQDLHAATDTTFGLWKYTYDPASNLTQQLDPNNQTVNYTYDALNRVATEDYTGASGTEITYTYDSCSDGKTRLCKVSTASATTSYAYNPIGLAKFATSTISNVDYATQYTYDRLGNITDLTYPNNTQVSYTFNNGGQVFSVRKKTPDSNWAEVASTTGYSPLGQLGTTTFANGVATANTYDPFHLYRLTSRTTCLFGCAHASSTVIATTTNVAATTTFDIVVIGAGGGMGGFSRGGGGGGSSAFVSTTTAIIAGGGGGGGGGSGSGNAVGGGGGGGYAFKRLTSLDGTYSVYIGSGGNYSGVGGSGYYAGADSNSSSGSGGGGGGGSSAAGNSSFSTSGVGGSGGSSAGGGGGGGNNSNSAGGDSGTGAAGGSTSGGSSANKGSATGGGGAGFGGGSAGGGGGGVGVNGDVNGAGGGGGGSGNVTGLQSGGGGGAGSSAGTNGNVTGPVAGAGGAGNGGGNGGAANLQGGSGGAGGAGNGTYSATYGVGGDAAGNPVGQNGAVLVSYKTGSINATCGGTATTTGATTTCTYTSNGTFTITAATTTGTTTLTTYTYGPYIQSFNYTYDADGNITQTVDNSQTGAGHSTSYTYDGLNRLIGANMSLASSTPYSQYYQYNPIGDLTYMGTSSPTGGDSGSLSLSVASAQYAYHNDASVLNITGDMTIEAWIKPNSMVNYMGLVSKTRESGTNPSAYAFYIATPSTWDFTSNLQGFEVPLSGSLSTSTWSHVAVVYDSTTKKAEFFLNGLSIGTSSAFSSNPQSDTFRLRVGTYGTDGTSANGGFDGLIDDLRIWNTKRTSTQLIANKGVELTGSESGLIAYYKFNQSYADSTSNADDLTAVNSPVFSSDTPPAMGSASTTPTHIYAGTGYANPHAPTTVFGVTVAYDNNGNATSSGAWKYTWDYRNRLTQAATGTATSTYAYDYMNQRMKQIIGSNTTLYPTKYWDVTGATSTSYIFLGDQIVANIIADGRATTTNYIHPDNLGSTNVVTNASGTPVQILDYLPYGGIRYSSSTASGSEKHQFIGQYTDNNGLNYLNARYLQNIQGQFLSQDPVFWGGQNIIDPQSLNSYSYANGNPIRNKDPDGKAFIVDDAISSGIGGMVGFDVYTIETALSGEQMTWSGSANYFVTGAVLADGIDNAPETGGLSLVAARQLVTSLGINGARAGAYGEIAGQTVSLAQGNQDGYDLGKIGMSSFKMAYLNILTLGIGDAELPGLSLGSNNWAALAKAMAKKLERSQIFNVSAQTSAKAAAGKQAAGIFRTAAGEIFNIPTNNSNSGGHGNSSGTQGSNVTSMGGWLGSFNPFIGNPYENNGSK